MRPFPRDLVEARTSLLLGYEAADHPDRGLYLTPTGALAHSRNSLATAWDSRGGLTQVLAHQARLESFGGVAGRPLEGAATNLCLRSENFGTTWAAIGTPTRVAAAKRVGMLVLDLLGDDAAGTLEGYSQVVTFTANAVKAVAVYMAQGTSTSSVVRLRDTSAAANRLLATITWSGGVPSVAMTTGTLIGVENGGGGVFRVLLQTSSVTAANTNQLEIYPATTSALVTTGTGTLYVGGVQAENALWPGSYLPTTSATVARVADVLTSSLLVDPQDCTVLFTSRRPTWADLSGALGAHQYALSWGASGARFALYGDASARNLVASLHDGSGAQTVSAAIPAGDIACAVQLTGFPDAPTVRLDVGGGFSSWSTATARIASWGSTLLALGDNAAAAGTPWNGSGRIWRVLPGLLTLSEALGRR